MWGQRYCNSLKDNSLEGFFLNWGSEVYVKKKACKDMTCKGLYGVRGGGKDVVADRGWIRGGSLLV
jgi:hypothetical protein